MDVNKTYSEDHFIKYTKTESLCCISKTIKIKCFVNVILIKNTNNICKHKYFYFKDYIKEL